MPLQLWANINSDFSVSRLQKNLILTWKTFYTTIPQYENMWSTSILYTYTYTHTYVQIPRIRNCKRNSWLSLHPF